LNLKFETEEPKEEADDIEEKELVQGEWEVHTNKKNRPEHVSI
jgi:hypothetical protein